MYKYYLLAFVILIIDVTRINAGELEQALNSGTRTFLYLYTQRCGFCTKFTPKYNKLSKMYEGGYKFVKLDANTAYGNKILRSYGGYYVPYVLLLDPKRNKATQILPSCLDDLVCIEGKMKDFSS